MTMRIEPSGQICGALIHGLDLAEPLSEQTVADIRAAWLDHHVIGFTDQSLDPPALQRFAMRLGPFGEDPFIAGMAAHPRVIEVRREANEQAPLFADNWHSDWSFLARPPAATLLYGVEIPPVGGDTLFANLHAAFEALPASRQHELQSLQAVHSARRSYARQGRYGDQDKGRSMAIRADDSALATQSHPLVRHHPETGRPALFISPAYTVGIAGMSEADSQALLAELFDWIDEPRFTYRHRWTPGLLTVWDNRCLNHRATGGYEGHRRLLHRITIGDRTP